MNNLLRASVKLLGTSLLLLLFIPVSLGAAASTLSPLTRRARLAGVTSFFARLILGLFNVRVSLKGRKLLRAGNEGRLVVSNHVSYIDVLVIASLAPSVFVTSVELRNTCLLGQLARLGGSLFVERRKASGLKHEINSIAQALETGFQVVLFPEGTTSNGDEVRPFKRSLLDAAIKAHRNVQPVCLRYTGVEGKPLSAKSRDAVFYYGRISFFKHFPRFLAIRSVDLEVSVLDELVAGDSETRKHLAERAHDAISAAYRAEA